MSPYLHPLSFITGLLLIFSTLSDVVNQQKLRRRLQQEPSTSLWTNNLLVTSGSDAHVSSSFEVAEESTKKVESNCALRPSKEMTAIPSWTASFPGSGGKLLWQIVEQITGITTTDDYDAQQRLSSKHCITVKTHFPFRQLSPNFFNIDTALMQHAILLIRNPLDTMRSYHKILYRYTEQNQEAEPPIEAWISWRDQNLNEQIQQWAKLVEWWVDNYYERLMILRFEDLVDPARGSEMFLQLRIFLGQVDANNAHQFTPENELNCLWNKMVTGGKQKKDVNFYTVNQLDEVIEVIEKLRESHQSVAHLNNVLSDYVKKMMEIRSQTLIIQSK